MARLLFMLVYFLGVVYGAAYPDPTPAAVLEERQFLGVITIWSPSLAGTSISYSAYSYGGTATVTTSGANWNWCDIGATLCYVATTCQGGTLFYQSPSTSIACSSIDPICGQDFLYQTEGGATGATRFACFSTAPYSRTFFLTSPTGVVPASPTTTSTSTTSTSTSSSPTPTQKHSSTPIGAIVGGVIGGLAIIGLVAIGIMLLLFRKKKNAQNQQAATVPPAAPMDNKHASYLSGNSPYAQSPPLPVYNVPGQGYPVAGSNVTPRPDSYAAPQGWPGQQMAPSPYQPQYGTPQPHPQMAQQQYIPMEMEAPVTHTPVTAPSGSPTHPQT